jgi:hypothetical protein
LGADIYGVIERYLEISPEMSIIILDEDFLLNRKRAMEFRDCVVRGGTPLSVFAFASIRAISQYEVTEILEMGIDGLWIGYEGTRSGYAKQSGRPVEEVFRELRENGVKILASMILGFPYQTPAIIEEELTGLLALEPTLAQFLIYGPSPGTPFFERVVREGLLHPEVAADPELFCRKGSGFHALVKHPSMEPSEIEKEQTRCFEEDFRRLGPSIYRSIETWFLGYRKLKDSDSSLLRSKAGRLAREIREAHPIFLVGKLLGPTAEIRSRIAALEARIHSELGAPGWKVRLESVAALGMAAWTAMTLKLGLFQHPRLIRHTFRLPLESRPARAWRCLRGKDPGGHSVEVERRPWSIVWVRVEGSLAAAGAGRLAAGLRRALARKKERMVLDLSRIGRLEHGAAHHMERGLRSYRHRIRVLLPRASEFASLAAIFSLHQ